MQGSNHRRQLDGLRSGAKDDQDLKALMIPSISGGAVISIDAGFFLAALFYRFRLLSAFGLTRAFKPPKV